jgi:hypothetical protein
MSDCVKEDPRFVENADFGKRFMIKFNVIPVIQSLVKNPIFGGR